MATVQHPSTSPQGRRRTIFPRFRSAVAVAGDHAPTDLDSMEAEIALLREDNARMRIGQAKPPDAGRLVERLRVLAEVKHHGEGGPLQIDDQGDEIWQILSEAMLVRSVLIDVCTEIGQVVLTLQRRLDSMAPQTGDAEAGCAVHLEGLVTYAS